MPVNKLINLYHFRVINVCEKYLVVTYRYLHQKSWGLGFVKKMTYLGVTSETFIRILMIEHYLSQ
jgi:hypothetical protein